jgi:hypothetical protein
MQDHELLAEHPPDNEQWFDQHGQVGQVLDQLPDAASNFTVPTMPTLRPKLRKVPRSSFSMAIPAAVFVSADWSIRLLTGPSTDFCSV